MRPSVPFAALTLVVATWPSLGRTTASAPFAALPAEPGDAWVSASAGFPWLEGRLQYGVARFMDVGIYAQSGWGHVQRTGASARFALHRGPATALGLGLAVDGWWARPASETWPAFTGRQDLSALVELAGSTVTPRGTTITLAIGPILIGTSAPPSEPLGGAAPPFALGWNARVRAAIEWPLDSGWTISVPVGLDLHRSGFDGLSAVPFGGLGLGWKT